MITARDISHSIREVEKVTGPLKPFDKQHVAVPKEHLRVLLAAAKHLEREGIWMKEPYESAKQREDIDEP